MEELRGPRPEDRIGKPKVQNHNRFTIYTILASLFVLIGVFSAYRWGGLDPVVATVDKGVALVNPPSAGFLDFNEIGLSSLPAEATRNQDVQKYLSMLRREVCDQESVPLLAEALKAAGFTRHGGEVLASYYNRCKGDAGLLDPAVEDFLAVSDFKRALQLSDALVAADPASSRYRYLRAISEEKLGMYSQSLIDHIDALNLLGDPRNVAGSEFYEVAQAYARLGRFCEAITPVQQWVSYDSANDSPQTQTIVKEFADKGSCKLAYAKIDASYSLPVKGGVIVATASVNGHEGRFIVDTGASFVTLTRRFAAVAEVSGDEKNIVQVQTANGFLNVLLTSARSVKLGPIGAQDVTVGIVDTESLGSDIDGLLGMSFLARFNVNLTPLQIEFKKAR